jgi:hypothetical protein
VLHISFGNGIIYRIQIFLVVFFKFVFVTSKKTIVVFLYLMRCIV